LISFFLTTKNVINNDANKNANRNQFASNETTGLKSKNRIAIIRGQPSPILISKILEPTAFDNAPSISHLLADLIDNIASGILVNAANIINDVTRIGIQAESLINDADCTANSIATYITNNAHIII